MTTKFFVSGVVNRHRIWQGRPLTQEPKLAAELMASLSLSSPGSGEKNNNIGQPVLLRSDLDYTQAIYPLFQRPADNNRGKILTYEVARAVRQTPTSMGMREFTKQIDRAAFD